jgi:hypothetical protein
MWKKGKLRLIRYVIAWVPMLIIAIANGALRQLTFGRVMSEIHAHQFSTVIGAVLIGLFVYVVIRKWPPSSAKQSFWIGLIWLMLTVAFEFAFGRWAMHRTWVQLLGDYNPAAERVWIVFLAWLTVAPYVFFKVRNAA